MTMSPGEGTSGNEGVPSPTRHQIRMAEGRAQATGEPISRVLAVFTGAARHGTAPGTESALRSEQSLAEGSSAPEGDGPAPLAPVIPLSHGRGDR